LKAGGKLRHRLKNNGGSYLSSHDHREVLGVGAAAQSMSSRSIGPRQVNASKGSPVSPANRYIHIIEGKGIV